MFRTIPEYVSRILTHLELAGFEAFLVGGCVRDEALGTPPHDYDITTDAHPDDILRVFRDFRVIETGIRHGTVTVISDGIPVEVTTYRIDGEYFDCRRPSSVTFTDNITLDLSRRDFTVNAMAYSPTRGLRDPFDGMTDLENRVIRCVGEAERRFSEDGLRILRALRFSSVLDFEIEDATADAVRNMAHLLHGISRERIDSEIRRLICGIGASKTEARYSAILASCLGTSAQSIEKLSEITDTLPPDPVARIAALAVSESPLSPQITTKNIMSSLKASSADCRRASSLAAECSHALPLSRTEILRMLGRIDCSELDTVASVRQSIGESPENVELFSKLSRQILSEDPCVRISQLAIDGNDVIRITGATGREVGQILALLLDDVIESRLENSRSRLEAACRRIYDNTNK